MEPNFIYTRLGKTSLPVHRLGLSATYWPGKKALYKALDEGVNYFFWFNIDYQMIRVLRDVIRTNRDRYVISTGAYNLIYGHPNLRRTLEKRLRSLGTDYIDVFLFLGVLKESEFSQKTKDEFYRLRDEGKARFIGLSTHNRRFAGKLAGEGAVDVIMIRYNASHRGAEQDIFPYLSAHNPGVVGYTATSWTYLLKRPRDWPQDQPIPAAGQCYRFVLSNPHIHVCLQAPRNKWQLTENLAALRQGPLSPEETDFMKKFGDAVYRTKERFFSVLVR